MKVVITKLQVVALALSVLAGVACAGGGDPQAQKTGGEVREPPALRAGIPPEIEDSTSSSSAPGARLPTAKPLVVKLPGPQLEGGMSVERALAERRSVRQFSDEKLSLEDLSQVLWAAYGVNRYSPRRNLRTAPSAGACYPLELYAVAGNVEGLAAGIYRYYGEDHALLLVQAGDVRAKLAEAALGQKFLEHAPATVFYAAVYERTMKRYGERGRERYVPMDLGHSAQNVYLQCAALGLGTVAVGAFDDEKVKAVMPRAEAEEPLYMMPIGRPKTE